MKYGVYVNQLSWLYHYPDATTKHIILFEYMKDFIDSDNYKIVRCDKGTWISKKKIIIDLPILRISTRSGITNLISQLVKWKIIERNTIVDSDSKLKKTYYTITETARDNLLKEISGEEKTRMAEVVKKRFANKKYRYKSKKNKDNTDK